MSTTERAGDEALDLTPDELLTTTRAVRKRLDLQRPVERDTLETCLRLAFQAPNGDNAQAYDWVLVDDDDTKRAMAEIYRSALDGYLPSILKAAEGGPAPELVRLGFPVDISSPTMAGIMSSAMHLREHLHEVPVLVVPTMRARLEQATIFEQASLWGSLLPAVWSFMLALRSRKMGSVWTTAHLLREREMAELLGIPYGEVTQAGLFPVAYTIGTEFKPAHRPAFESVLHWGRW